MIPVVGDLSGPRALAAIGSRLRQQGQRLSAFYASNVEFYLFGDGRFGRFVTNLGGMPRADNGVVIRSVFGRFAGYGGGSSQHLQSLDELVAASPKGRFRATARSSTASRSPSSNPHPFLSSAHAFLARAHDSAAALVLTCSSR